MTSTTRAARVEAAFRAFVADPDFPCLAGKGAMRALGFRVHVYGVLGSERSARCLARDLAPFAAALPADGSGLNAFVAVFPRGAPRDEAEFEREMWRALQRLHAYDDPHAGWDPAVSSDPRSPEFSYSFNGHAMFVVGMHPASSRMARQFRWPTLVFNPHAQFERMREDGRFAPLQAAVRKRELALQGSINPNLATFGERSEAREYSGRATGQDWQCPFHAKRS